ncbi:MAG: hypothetical protein FWD14_07610 [Treponema sp.]|nr:hypothetical protein [Treponema sp.]
MSIKTKNEATKEQIEKLILDYNSREKIFDILYTGKVRTLIMLEHALEKGITITRLAGGTMPVSLPECRNGEHFYNNMYSEKTHFSIVRRVLTNFVNNNPQYFTLKPKSSKYAISDQFVYDLLLFNKDKELDHIEFLDLLPLIGNQNIFEEIAKLFYLPYEKNETLAALKRKCWQRGKTFTFNTSSSIEIYDKKFILYDSQEIKSIKIDEFIKEMKIYYDSNLEQYHKVAYCTYFPSDLVKLSIV